MLLYSLKSESFDRISSSYSYPHYPSTKSIAISSLKSFDAISTSPWRIFPRRDKTDRSNVQRLLCNNGSHIVPVFITSSRFGKCIQLWSVFLHISYGNFSIILSTRNMMYRESNCESNDTPHAYVWSILPFLESFCRSGTSYKNWNYPVLSFPLK